VGVGKAKELIYTAKMVGGKEAAEIGLVQHCVAQNSEGDAAYQKSLEIAKQIIVNVSYVLGWVGRNLIHKKLILQF